MVAYIVMAFGVVLDNGGVHRRGLVALSDPRVQVGHVLVRLPRAAVERDGRAVAAHRAVDVAQLAPSAAPFFSEHADGDRRGGWDGSRGAASEKRVSTRGNVAVPSASAFAVGMPRGICWGKENDRRSALALPMLPNAYTQNAIHMFCNACLHA